MGTVCSILGSILCFRIRRGVPYWDLAIYSISGWEQVVPFWEPTIYLNGNRLFHFENRQYIWIGTGCFILRTGCAFGLEHLVLYGECSIQWTWPIDHALNRRGIKTEEKAKVVASVWGWEFTQFLASLAVLPRTILNNRMNCTRMIWKKRMTWPWSAFLATLASAGLSLFSLSSSRRLLSSTACST